MVEEYRSTDASDPSMIAAARLGKRATTMRRWLGFASSPFKGTFQSYEQSLRTLRDALDSRLAGLALAVPMPAPQGDADGSAASAPLAATMAIPDRVKMARRTALSRNREAARKHDQHIDDIKRWQLLRVRRTLSQFMHRCHL